MAGPTSAGATTSGFRYPGETSVPDVPLDIYNLANDVESYTAKIGHTHAYANSSHTHSTGDMSPWTWSSYTPTPVNAATNAAFGIGTGTTLTGRYLLTGKLCHLSVSAALGSGSFTGMVQGNYIGFRLPFTSASVSNMWWAFPTWLYLPTTPGYYAATTLVGAGSGHTNYGIANSQNSVRLYCDYLVSGTRIHFTGIYEVA